MYGQESVDDGGGLAGYGGRFRRPGGERGVVVEGKWRGVGRGLSRRPRDVEFVP